MKSFMKRCCERSAVLMNVELSRRRCCHPSPVLFGIAVYQSFLRCALPATVRGVKEVQEVTHHSPLQEQELQLERTALDMWIKDVMELFCGMIFRWDLGVGQPVLGTPANEFILAVGNESDPTSLDDLENTLHDGTAALWVLREAMVLVLLLLWALHSCSACE
ncbi:hypothetical protein C3747_330g16 [Trypanosoma cruzi]|uniref:Uncharacterized protein n=1 Tax=Trypanosoma cruzi TaxID=5693 RepID=A0A2V2VA27_TRYCR|nr:hypothetical protein C3747_330g16 [Trypanosoma cruzi]